MHSASVIALQQPARCTSGSGMLKVVKAPSVTKRVRCSAVRALHDEVENVAQKLHKISANGEERVLAPSWRASCETTRSLWCVGIFLVLFPFTAVCGFSGLLLTCHEQKMQLVQNIEVCQRAAAAAATAPSFREKTQQIAFSCFVMVLTEKKMKKKVGFIISNTRVLRVNMGKALRRINNEPNARAARRTPLIGSAFARQIIRCGANKSLRASYIGPLSFHLHIPRWRQLIASKVFTTRLSPGPVCSEACVHVCLCEVWSISLLLFYPLSTSLKCSRCRSITARILLS